MIPAEDASLSVRSLSSTLRASGPAPRPTPGYRLALAATAALVVALPLLYLALVAAIGWGAWWWALEGGRFFERARLDWTHLLTRWGPSFVGALVFLALLKPIVARRQPREEPLSVDPAEEPLLFAWVARVAELAQAPMPRRIDVDLQVNASASFRRGLASFLSHDLVLTLGLPLVGALDLRQLTSVLAHELGHFAQGAGMRSTYLIHIVQRWFHRVVFERDGFDRALEVLGRRSGNLGVMALLNGARAGVWLSRKVLLGLMHVGQAVVSSLSRQMEFDADRHAMRTAGSEAFASAMETIHLLDQASHGAGYDVNQGLQEGRLGDDWVALVRANLAGMPEEVRSAALREAHSGGRAHMYASHPPCGERLARARSAGLPSGVGLDLPAEALLRDPADLSRRLTRALYRSSLGEGFHDAMLEDSGELNRRVERDLAARRAAHDALEGRWCASLLLPPGPLAPAADASPAGLVAAREREHGLRGALDAVLEKGLETERRVVLQRSGQAFLRAGIKIKRREFELDRKVPERDLDGRLQDAEDLYAPLAEHAAAVRARLAQGLGLLLAEEPVTPEDDERRSRIRAAVAALEALGPLGPLAVETARSLDLLDVVVPVLLENDPKGRAGAVLAGLAADLVELERRVTALLAERPYPFDHAEGPLPLHRFLFGAPLEGEPSLEGQAERLAGFHARATSLQARAMGILLEEVLALERSAETARARSA